MKLTLNISPCPNDTFMFDALLNGRIDTRGIEFIISYLDIDQLNERLLSGRGPDVSKISYALLPAVLPRYRLLDAGSALGYGTGPVLVAQKYIDPQNLTRVAIPGEQTTAARLLGRFFPHITERPVYLFSDIAPAIRRGEVEAGVLIHEGRFTYKSLGLSLLADLGQLWENEMQAPLPLGAIVVSRHLPENMQLAVQELIRESIRYAFAYPEVSRDFVHEHAQELDEEVIRNHITTFVNDYSLGLDRQARAGICALLDLTEKEVFA